MTQTQYSPPAHRPMLVVDVENSSGRPEQIRSVLQRDAFGLIARALAEAGFAERDYTVDERGDGALVVMPPGCSKARVTDVFMRDLPIWLRRRNELASAAARLRLRVGMNCGDAVYTSQHSWLGTAVDTLFRLVDAPVTKRALAAAAEAPMVLVVSDAWFQDAVRPGLGDTFESDFGPLQVAAHGKQFAAWLAVPGLPGRGTAPAVAQPAESEPSAAPETAAVEPGGTEPGGTEPGEAGSFDDLTDSVLLPAARSGKPAEHDAAAACLFHLGEAGDGQAVRRLVRSWARAAEPGRRAVAARALGRRAGRMEPAEASDLLTGLASEEDPLVGAALAEAIRLAAAGSCDRDRAGAWILAALAGWTGHRDGRVRRGAGLALLALAADLDRAGDPGAAGRAGERQGRDDPDAADPAGAAEGSGESPPPWPGLLWFGELSAEPGRAVAALWAGALAAPEFTRPARAALDLYARRVEPYPERREAFARLVKRIAERDERIRGLLAVRAQRWSETEGAGAPKTGALACRVLDP